MWIVYALFGSLFWGLSYITSEQMYKKMSVFTTLGLTAIFVGIISLLIAITIGAFKPDLLELSSSKTLMWYFLAGTTFLLIAELFIGFSIAEKNATLAGLVEISYPIFIAIFSYILYKQSISPSTIMGGAIIFIGIFIIYYFNQ